MIQEGFGKHSNFLLGQVTREPNALYYPIAFLLRTTPATLPGIFAAMVWLWWRGKYRLFANNESAQISESYTVINTAPAQDLVLFALLAYICSFVLYMSVASKKFDRYILPIFPIVDLLATWGWKESFRRFITRKHWRMMGIAVLLVLQIWSTVPHYPYYLTAYNPLFGRTAGAARAILVGWGEGLDLVADYLNDLDNAETSV